MSIRGYSIQTEPYTDHITDDGQELTKSPYPIVADLEGRVAGSDFWCGLHHQVIGFQNDLSVQEINLRWPDFTADPQSAVGMYLVTSNSSGDWGTLWTAVRSVRVLEAES